MHSLFLPAALAYAEKPAQPAPAVAVDGIGDDVRRAVGEDEARSDDELEIARHAPQLVARHGHLAGERMLHEDVFAGSGAVAQLLGRRHAVLAQILERAIGAHDAGDRVAVGDAEAGLAEEQRRQHHVLRMGGAAQEREIGGRDQLGVAIAALMRTTRADTSAGSRRRRKSLRGTARSGGLARPRCGSSRGPAGHGRATIQ